MGGRITSVLFCDNPLATMLTVLSFLHVFVLVCEDKFEGQVETNVEGATPYHDYESLEDCQDLCRKMPECLAIDYDRNDPPYKNSRCWIHDEESLVSGTKPQPAVDHYTRVPCNQGPGMQTLLISYCTFGLSINLNQDNHGSILN